MEEEEDAPAGFFFLQPIKSGKQNPLTHGPILKEIRVHRNINRNEYQTIPLQHLEQYEKRLNETTPKSIFIYTREDSNLDRIPRMGLFRMAFFPPRSSAFNTEIKCIVNEICLK